MDDDCKPWRRNISAVILISVCLFIVGSASLFAVKVGRFKTDRDDAEGHFDFPIEGEAKAWISFDDHAPDLVECKTLMFEKDPTTGVMCFMVDGSPVHGKLKAYLDARLMEGDMPIFRNHPDGESNKWMEMPMPLFLSLTDKSPSP